MAITLIQALSAGNALRVFITPPAGAVYWRVLRRTADVFTGFDDAGAVSVTSATTDNAVLDVTALVNGTEYFYRFYSWDGSACTDAGVSVTATPATTYLDQTIDPLTVVISRIALGLAAEVARGNLVPAKGFIPVFNAPYALPEKITFPMVTVHLDRFGPTERFIGEDIESGIGDDGFWRESEGFLARSAMNIAGVSLNSDERIQLRLALVRILQANFQVFSSLGLTQIEFAFADSEQLANENSPLFLTGGSFTCTHMSFVLTEPSPVLSVPSGSAMPYPLITM